MNRFKSKKEWLVYMINKNYDADPYIVIDNAKAFLKKSSLDFSEYSTDDLENAEIV